jgi:tetratricopeptide (TPR) repeat protein
MMSAEFEKLKEKAKQYLQKGKMKDAKKQIDKMIALEPDNINGYEWHDFYLSAARDEYEDEDRNYLDKRTVTEERIKIYTRMLEINPQDDGGKQVDAYYDWGLWSLLADAHASYCCFYSNDINDMEKAIEVINKGIECEKDGDDVLYQNNLYTRASIFNQCLEFLSEERFGERDPKFYDEVYPGARDQLLSYYDAFIDHVEEMKNTPEVADSADLYSCIMCHEEKADVLLSLHRYADAIPSLEVVLANAKHELAEATEDMDDEEDDIEEWAESEFYEVRQLEEKIAFCKGRLNAN